MPENSVIISLLTLGESQVPTVDTANMAPHGVVAAARIARSAVTLNVGPRDVFYLLANLVCETYGKYAAEQGKGEARFVSKEIVVWRQLDLLDCMFNYSARFIYIARHGVACGISRSERGDDDVPIVREHSFNLGHYVSEWVQCNEATMDFCERNSDRCHFIRYEDLVAEPEMVARGILEFLGEPWFDSLFDVMQKSVYELGGDQNIYSTGGRVHAERKDHWRLLPQASLVQLGRIANGTLVRLGYEALAGGA